ncbi:DUF1611 domain-containing protein [Georgenia sp. EYE_87]|uniref:DUF1611 domain-containing protein n=1 Tax=Georgenia sp. EYE_87 TaxID=2853448 RepID=UPI002006BD84|nr:DUF1611 domain-containing protein [Georgenia sp. EYE_87]
MTVTASTTPFTGSPFAGDEPGLSSEPGAAALPPGGARQEIPELRLRWAKKAYTTRYLAERLAADARGYGLLTGAEVRPSAGDVVLARVVRLGQHKRLEGPGSRRQTLFVGDEVLVAYGHRYAPDQFEAEVPDDLRHTHLVAAGGLTGVVTGQHARMEDATTLEPLGLLADDQGVVTLGRLAPQRLLPDVPGAPHGRFPTGRPTVIAVLGTSMNSGKSTTLACLVRGLVSSGLAVAAGKVTGTGAGGDPRLFADAGASAVLDFTDFGLPSTFRLDHGRVRALLASLVHALAATGPDVVVVEIADGIYQAETGRLLRDPLFRAVVDRVVFAAGDALGATAGVGLLRAAGIDVAAVSGVLTSSPLATREATAAVDVAVLPTFDLTEPEAATALLPR